MNFNEYRERTGETAIYPGRGEVTGLMYAALGLVSELGELEEKKGLMITGRGTKKERSLAYAQEAGDVLWYCAEVINQLFFVEGLDLTERFDLVQQDSISHHASEIAGLIKKYWRDGSLRELTLADHVINLLYALELELNEDTGFNLADAFELNLAKLAKRKENGTIGGSGDER